MIKTIEELKEYMSFHNLERSQFFSEPETVEAIIGHDPISEALIYDYDKLVECFADHFANQDGKDMGTCTADEFDDYINQSVDWIDYNTLRSLPYKFSYYVVYDDNNIIDTIPFHPCDEGKPMEIVEYEKNGKRVEIEEFVNPIVMMSCEAF